MVFFIENLGTTYKKCKNIGYRDDDKVYEISIINIGLYIRLWKKYKDEFFRVVRRVVGALRGLELNITIKIF